MTLIEKIKIESNGWEPVSWSLSIHKDLALDSFLIRVICAISGVEIRES